MRFKLKTKKLLKKIGYDVVSYNHSFHDEARKSFLINQKRINLFFDVGANIGQYAQNLRLNGYNGNIVSFEPISSVFDILINNSSQDPKWFVENFALGESNNTLEINVSKNTYSSSILDILPEHLKSSPSSEYISREKITIKTLDSIYDNYIESNQNIYLKIDTQGYSLEVLNGAKNCIKGISIVQIETSLIQLYDNEPLIEEIIDFMRCLNFVPVSIENGHCNHNTGQLVQADIIFSNNSMVDYEK